MYQRIFSARDAGTARKAILIWVFGVALLETSIYFLGLTGAIAAKLEVGPHDQVADFEPVHEHLGDELLRFEMADLGEVEHPDSADA